MNVWLKSLVTVIGFFAITVGAAFGVIWLSINTPKWLQAVVLIFFIVVVVRITVFDNE